MGNYYILYVVAVLATIKSAQSIMCWECNSSEGQLCADYFNVTHIRRYYPNAYNPGRNFDPQTPKEKNCDETRPFIGNQKSVCLKKVQTVYGTKQYTRQCASININEPVGSCPTETSSSRDIVTDFCQYCENQSCNGAPATGMAWVTLVPVVTLLVTRK